jgi:alkylation response protein AidB-like acyl-CoA dehydrogenase
MLTTGANALAEKIFPKASSAKDFLVACPSFSNPAQEDNLPEAARSGRDYTVSGTLKFLVLGGLANRAVIPACTISGGPFSFFLIDLDQEGIEKSGPVFSLGLHACPAVDVTFKNAKACLIGKEGEGGIYFQKVSRTLYAAAAAMNAGIMRGSFDEAFAYAKERFQGGCEIINWSEVSMSLANMLVKADVADLCVAQVCQSIEQGAGQWDRHGIAAALHIHELACDVVTDGIQVLGGNGYMKDYGQEKRYRDAHQVQSLLGVAPMKKIAMIRELAGLNDACAEV